MFLLFKKGRPKLISARKYRSWTISVFVLGLGILVTGLMWKVATLTETEKMSKHITADAQLRTALINDVLNADIESLNSVERLFTELDQMSREQFRSVAQTFLKSHPSLTAIEYAPLVSAQNRPAFEAQVKSQGIANYHITEIDQEKTLKARANYETYYPVSYTEPFEANQSAMGFDYYSDKNLRTLMNSAIINKTTTITPFLRLFRSDEETTKPSHFYVFVPHFEKGSTSKMAGFIVGVFQVSRVLGEAFSKHPNMGLEVQLTDQEDRLKAPFMTYPRKPDRWRSGFLRNVADLTVEDEVQILGRTWMLSYNPSREYVEQLRSWHPISVLVAGISLSILSALSLMVVWFRDRRERKVIAERSSETLAREEMERKLVEEKVSESEARAAMEQKVLDAQEELRHEVNIHAAVVELQQKLLLNVSDYKTSMTTLVKQARSLAAADAVILELTENNEIICDADTSLPHDFAAFGVKRDGGLSTLCLKQNSVVICNDIENDERLDKEACRQMGVQSVIALPLPGISGPGGVLKVMSRKTGAFSDRKVNTLRAIAGMMSIPLREANVMSSLADKEKIVEQASKLKDQCLTNMSHEIRVPVNTILGYAESILVDRLSVAEREEATKSIQRNAERLLTVANNILDLSNLEADKLEIEMSQVDIFDVLHDVAKQMKPLASAKGIALGFDYAFPLPRTIRADENRLRQVLVNLVGNAIKFTQIGGVKVSVKYSVEENRLILAVCDTGIGMTPEQRNNLFQAFNTGDASTRGFDGAGLGLVLASKLAQRLGGSIDVESSPGAGSTFTLNIATADNVTEDLVAKVPATRRKGTAATEKKVRYKGKVLIAEHAVDNQRLLSALLKKAKVDFSIVENGIDAVTQVQAEKYDLVLMDMQMPIMDGYMATKVLRENGSNIPIVGLTETITKSEVERCLASGCSGYLGKPFERNAFFAQLTMYLAEVTNKSDLQTGLDPVSMDPEPAI